MLEWREFGLRLDSLTVRFDQLTGAWNRAPRPVPSAEFETLREIWTRCQETEMSDMHNFCARVETLNRSLDRNGSSPTNPAVEDWYQNLEQCATELERNLLDGNWGVFQQQHTRFRRLLSEKRAQRQSLLDREIMELWAYGRNLHSRIVIS